ncbi:MAG TPA: tetratricopeptide repeat protein [Thermoanaerobaculia bacterium]|nr:tetratricopeptide repeat protein [Thermoanaerobaculia bacterium]
MPAPVERVEPPPEERPFLPYPTTGLRTPISPQAQDRVQEGFYALNAGDLDAAGRIAAELLAGEEPPPPAAVLAAQVDLLLGRYADAVERLEPVVAEHPLYVAAQLVLGRAAERGGDLVRAYAAYGAVAALAPEALVRNAELAPRVTEVLAARLQDAVDRGRMEVAEATLARMIAWFPEADATLGAARTFAVARGDRDSELVAVREMARRAPEDRELAEDRAELELAVGDPGVALDIYQRFADENPNDPELADRLSAAKFLWRVTQLPDRVQQVVATPELQRGDLAVLLYWLVPRVRSSRAGAPRIASDILDDPRRSEIAQIVNLDLMPIDQTLHRFYPDRVLTRREALAVVLRTLAHYDAGCRPAPESAAPVCSAAVACGLVAEEAACRPEESLPGSDALELLRRTAERLGS